tara:strand:+ start:826 stop:993 length:168 start_codon:yes stop_codon:yes gene_type:complete
MNLNCTKVLQKLRIQNGKANYKNVVCNKPLKKIGFWEDFFGVYRLACEDHRGLYE